MDMKWVKSSAAPQARTFSRVVRWICAEDRQPEKTGTYLACGKNGDVWMPFYHATVKKWWLAGLEIGEIVWYWAEMPETPKEEKDG